MLSSIFRKLSYVLFVFLLIHATLSHGSTRADEMRFKNISQGLRCVICNNESIYESDSTLAIDIRKLIKVKISKGESSAEIVSYLHQRYGDMILLRPDFNSETYIFWLLIGFLLLCLGLIVGIFFRTRHSHPSDGSIERDSPGGVQDDQEDIKSSMGLSGVISLLLMMLITTTAISYGVYRGSKNEESIKSFAYTTSKAKGFLFFDSKNAEDKEEFCQKIVDFALVETLYSQQVIKHAVKSCSALNPKNQMLINYKKYLGL